jgi:hypothetical protein
LTWSSPLRTIREPDAGGAAGQPESRSAFDHVGDAEHARARA